MQGNVSAAVCDVQKTQQYVMHSVTLHSGTICVGDTVTLLVDKVPSHAAVIVIVIIIIIKFLGNTGRPITKTTDDKRESAFLINACQCQSSASARVPS